MSGSLTTHYFDAIYARDPDPWCFEASPYEDAKYRATLDALPAPRYRRVLEVGCSIGVLTEWLASRCDELVGVDPAQRALAQARRRCAHLAGVSLRQNHVPGEWPDGDFDLILLSEVVYYLDRPDVARLADRILGSLRAGGHVLMVHWIRETDYPLSGDEASDLLMSHLGRTVRVIRQGRTPEYRLDLLQSDTAGTPGCHPRP
ncbi:MAG: class I SAM-dependent methyltransferase [Pseudomonadota bacterium]